ncbi:hypothetical protein F8388_019180 [Cannabis sativa]|uniref:Plant heme peroxidase family profile domain-containing protein n=1 Tax=Cannabis sativa TaxID=3483 RepID=A0A7J6F5N4_CANSA|nr:hypothetical protein F8388_019180 [Cannabis sativa]
MGRAPELDSTQEALRIPRVHFYDYFVHGCDSSILIEGATNEKTAPRNTGITGYTVVGDTKQKLEVPCSGIVSYVDILALTARDSINILPARGDKRDDDEDDANFVEDAPLDESFSYEDLVSQVRKSDLTTFQKLKLINTFPFYRVGEMEVWALEGFGVAHILQEMLTYKSDHIRARQEVLGTTIIGGPIPKPEDAPESFRLLVRELRSLALELNHFLVSEKNFQPVEE